ncbi:GyrI-like domain-containing protein [Dyadobacter luticola]|uniref:GyrI-like domain-containing protein n=1 Tax=Dyadobacter luticola TaxID=1979387 RepID=A0A5R9L4U9_9BACT|nr:GyrI-like domain-containing protein [Dyadobacter luticola]TLV03379.1 GyrI-like domain-containing protein [Dyadobacter luticola]
MLSEPKTEFRPERPYLAIRKKVHMFDIPNALPPLIPEVKQWMDQRKIEPAGYDFFLYKSIDPQNELECEAGFPVARAVEGDEYVQAGAFPAGNYASLVYTGDFKYMMEAHKALESWIEAQGLKEKRETIEGTACWGSRTEVYLVDPTLEPNPEKWQTEIVFQLED